MQGSNQSTKFDVIFFYLVSDVKHKSAWLQTTDRAILVTHLLKISRHLRSAIIAGIEKFPVLPFVKSSP